MKKILCLLLAAILSFTFSLQAYACTTFSVKSSKVYYGRNRDWNPEYRYALSFFMKDLGSGVLSFEVRSDGFLCSSVNNKGFFTAVNTSYITNPDVYPVNDGKLDLWNLYENSVGFTNVSEVKNLVNQNGVRPDNNQHIFFADAGGNSIVVESDNTNSYIIEDQNDFLIATNFPLYTLDDLGDLNNSPCDRYNNSYNYISQNIASFNLNEAINVLKNTSRGSTNYSIVCDPEQNVVYLFLNHYFDKAWKISFDTKTIKTDIGFGANEQKEISFGDKGIPFLELESFEFGVNQNPPDGLVAVPPTTYGAFDGKIVGTTSAMEYKLSSATDYMPATDIEISGLKMGTYNIRYAAKSGYNASEPANIVLKVPGYSAVTSIGLIKPDKNLDNNYSAAILPDALDPDVTYEYAFATSDGGDPHPGPYGTWFETNSAGVGTYTKGLINNHVNIPITYYDIAPANNLWLLIRDKENPDDRKYLQLVPDTSAMDNFTSANSFVSFGASFENFLSQGVSGGACLANNISEIISARIPVGVPFNYLFTDIISIPGNDNAGWATTMLQYDSSTSKSTIPEYLMYPQNPNAGKLYFKSLTATAEVDPLYFQSDKSARLIGSTENYNKFGSPEAPNYITVSVDDGIIALNNIKPFTYEYILSNSETAPTDWSNTLTFQNSTGSVNINTNSEKYIYIRTMSGLLLTQSSPTAKISLSPNANQTAPTGLVGLAPTMFGNFDGKIIGTTNDMEYKPSTEYNYISATDIETIGLASGTYLVRYKAKPGFNASPAVEVTIPDGEYYYTVSGYVKYSGVTITTNTGTAISDLNGYFSFNLQIGYYDLVITRPGAIRRTIPITADSDLILSDSINKLTLILGDANQDGIINVSDIGLVKTNYGKSSGNENFDINCDATQDGYINVSDIGITKTNYGKTTNSY